MSETYIGAIDQGTTSTRFILFNHKGKEVASSQREHRQIFPKPGWVEHDPEEIWDRTCEVIRDTLKKAGVSGSSVAAVGITNQRETTLVWDAESGKPLYNAIVWQDTRTADIIEARKSAHQMLTDRTGLPPATYFSASKLTWMRENVPQVASGMEKGSARFGTIDSWLVWKLTGGQVHATDVTNASRTLLMDIRSCSWDKDLMELWKVPESALPEIRSSIAAEAIGMTSPDGPLGAKVPIGGILGDQQAALFGQACFSRGESKNTYGTGCFLLLNTAEELIRSRFGLLSTVAYRWGKEPVQYALEGSVAVAGALVQWVRDNLGLIKESPEIETLAKSVEDCGGVYFVPAFSGLFAPHWRSDARGIVAGLTGYARSGHIARAVLEATAFQTRELLEAMEKDSGLEIPSLRVDGGMVKNELLMQFQADILGLPVIRPEVTETTALGAAYAAGLSAGFWESKEELASQWREDKRWLPNMDSAERGERFGYWKKAVERSMGWID